MQRFIRLSLGIVSLSISVMMNAQGASSTSAGLSSPRSTTVKGWYFFNAHTQPIKIKEYVPVDFSQPEEKVVTCESGKNIFIKEPSRDDPIIIKNSESLSISLNASDLPKSVPNEEIFCAQIIIQENLCETHKMDYLDEDSAGYRLCNRFSSEHENLFYAWYSVEKLAQKQVTFPRGIRTGSTLRIYKPKGKNLSLVLGLHQDWLKSIGYDQRSFSFSEKQLSDINSRELRITGNTNQAINIDQHKDTIELINTTSQPLHYSLFAHEGERDKKIAWVSHVIQPQESTYFSRETGGTNSTKSYDTIVLYVSTEKLHAQDLKSREKKASVAPFDLSPGSSLPQRLVIKYTLENGPCIFSLVSLEEDRTSLVSKVLDIAFSKKSLPTTSTLSIPLLTKCTSPLSHAQDKDSMNLKEIKIGSMPQEALFTSHRQKKIWKAILELVGEDSLGAIARSCGLQYTPGSLLDLLDQYTPPKIGLAIAGGSYQSMIDAIAFLGAADQQKLIDCCLYMTGTSGSALAITSLVASGKDPKTFCEHQRSNAVLDNTQLGAGTYEIIEKLMLKVITNREFIGRIALQSCYQQPQGLLALFGHALAENLLKGFLLNNHTVHDIVLSDLQHNLNNGQYPLPICTAADYSGAVLSDQGYFEFSPYSVTNYVIALLANKQGFAIRTEGFGSLYKEGKLIHQAPEYPLAQLFGIWGFPSVYFSGLLDSPSKDRIKQIITKAKSNFEKIGGAEDSLDLGGIPNYLLYSQRGAISQIKTLQLGEANVPVKEHQHVFAITPLLAREVDLIIMYDSSHNAKNGSPKQLYAVENDAQTLHLPFPSIGEQKHDQPSVCLIDDKKGPCVVYVRARKHSQHSHLARSYRQDSLVCEAEEYNSRLQNARLDITESPQILDNIKQGILECVKRAFKKK